MLKLCEYCRNHTYVSPGIILIEPLKPCRSPTRAFATRAALSPMLLYTLTANVNRKMGRPYSAAQVLILYTNARSDSPALSTWMQQP
jgi:hypothetical protein